ncbi:MAG: GSCFA domain-containing protein, partial [Phycisphaerales bacterium JB038]
MPKKPPDFRVSPDSNRSWPRYNHRGIITLPANPLLDPGATVFTMGSCFALEIRRWLGELGCQVVPAYADLEFDLARLRIGQLPKRLNLNHYHTFAIRQEIERCLGIWQQSPDDHWEVRPDRWFGGEVAYQDPYRRGIFARTPDDLHQAIADVDDVVRAGLETADVFLITLGLTEVWRKRDDGRFACMTPGFARGGGKAETEFHASTLAENVENLRRTVELIGAARPTAQIV